MRAFLQALRTVFASRIYWIMGAAGFLVFLVVYLMTLPATFTGGRVGFVALRFVNTELVLWSVLMAALLGLLMPFTFYLLRRGYRARTGAAAGGVIVGLVTPLLCCTPVIPIVFSFLAGLFPALAGSAGGVAQGFLATHETLFFSVATLLLIYALYRDARKIAEAACCRT
ncbi:MAG: hypothetical protein ACYDB9_02530 [Gammaproteobacteria bacterium]